MCMPPKIIPVSIVFTRHMPSGYHDQTLFGTKFMYSFLRAFPNLQRQIVAN